MPRIQNYNYYIIHLFSYTLKIAAFNACKVIDTFNLKAELKIKTKEVSHVLYYSGHLFLLQLWSLNFKQFTASICVIQNPYSPQSSNPSCDFVQTSMF